MKLFLLLFLLPILTHAQPLQGYYRDFLRTENGTPVNNAVILNKTSGDSTVSNAAGFFEIKVTEGDVLLLNYDNNIRETVITKPMIKLQSAPYQPAGLQPVMPVVTTAYEKALQKKSSVPAIPVFASTGSLLSLAPKTPIQLPVKTVVVKNGQLHIKPLVQKRLTLAGSYNIVTELKMANAQPALQTLYAQGREGNWRGAETNELFSYGPGLAMLEYDGTGYDYDPNGRFVNKGSGNGRAAAAPGNSVIRTGALLSQSLTIAGRIRKSGYDKWNFSNGFTHSTEQALLQQNRNSSYSINSSTSVYIKKNLITACYNYQQQNFSNSNRNGFLNRVYMNALLTPAGFQNSGGFELNGGQRSYSRQADNPYFLLSQNGNGYVRRQYGGAFSIEKKISRLQYKIAQSLEQVKETSEERYKPATAYFEDGIFTVRNQQSRHYSLNTYLNYTTYFDNSDLKGEATFNYIFSDAQTRISYPAVPAYRYQRSTHEANLSYLLRYDGYRFNAGGSFASRFYFSNTASKNHLFLPSLTLYAAKNQIGNRLDLKLLTSYSSFAGEAGFNQHTAQTNLLQLNTSQLLQFFPTREITHYQGLRAILYKEWNVTLEATLNRKWQLNTEWFFKKTNNDIFPVLENNRMVMKNAASHRNRGVEVEAAFNPYDNNNKTFFFNGSASFLSYRNRVTQLAGGYSNIPYAGFSNVHKALVAGAPLGVIIGNTWLRDAAGNQIIGADGFPLVNNQLSVIGDPNPDYILKMHHRLRVKKWSMSADWEWRKGGDVWNGTRAVLDYYGRSQQSAGERDISGYVFKGVLQNGQPNNIPVQFYNTAQPLSQNRWVRYGYTGVAEDYIDKADQLRLSNITFSRKWTFRKHIQQLVLSAYVRNWVLWQARKGVDAGQLLLDQPGGGGLDFFNIPSAKNFGCNLSIQF
jgi:hypothetical protein